MAKATSARVICRASSPSWTGGTPATRSRSAKTRTVRRSGWWRRCRIRLRTRVFHVLADDAGLLPRRVRVFRASRWCAGESGDRQRGLHRQTPTRWACPARRRRRRAVRPSAVASGDPSAPVPRGQGSRRTHRWLSPDLVLAAATVRLDRGPAGPTRRLGETVAFERHHRRVGAKSRTRGGSSVASCARCRTRCPTSMCTPKRG